MHIASRTPEGQPGRCSVCSAHVVLEPSHPPGDAPCPACGSLMWFEPKKRRVTHLVWVPSAEFPAPAPPGLLAEFPRPVPPAERLVEVPQVEARFEEVSPAQAAQMDALYAALDMARQR